MAGGLGQILVEQGVVSRDELRRAEDHAGDEGSTLTRALVSLGLAREPDLVRALAEKLDMPYTGVDPDEVEEAAAALLSRSVARELSALPIGYTDAGDLLVAVAEPNNTAARDRIVDMTGLPVKLALAPRSALEKGIEHLSSPDPEEGAEDPEGLQGGIGPRVQAEEPTSIALDDLLVELVQKEGSDLHLTAGIPPAVRIDGDLATLDDYPTLTPDELRKMLYAIMTQKHREQFENNLELDMSYAIPGHARFRVNIFQQRDAVGAVMRVIPFEIKSLEDLGLPSQISKFAYMPRGFVLVTGSTGSGKSTTLASIIDLINRNRPVHIMTVEDPIEFLHRHKTAVVNQREVGTDTLSFANALKHALRQDPDVILVGEMRDLETIQIALTAAETGHLVFGTLHTQDAPQTVDRVIDVFPPHQQEQVRVQLAGSIAGVVSQTLMKRADGDGRVVGTEVMMATSGIRNLIREGKTHQIYSAIQSGAQHGMESLDQSLARLVKNGEVAYEVALEKCSNLAEFERLAGRAA